MRVGRVVWFFAFAFGSIVIPVVGSLLYGFLTYRPPFAVSPSIAATDWEALTSNETSGIAEVEPGAISDDPGIEQTVRLRFQSGGRATLVRYASSDQAAERGPEVLQRTPTDSTTVILGKYFTYHRSDDEVYGVLFADGPWVLISEAPTEAGRLSQLRGLPFLSEQGTSPMVSLFQDHLAGVLAAIGIYVLTFLFTWPRLASWATKADPVAGIAPLSESRLRERLLALNDQNLPFSIHTGEREDELVAEWRYADAVWMGVMSAAGVKSLARIKLRLDAEETRVRAQDNLSSVEWSAGAGGGLVNANVSWSWFKGINFVQYERGVVGGLVLSKDGKPTLSNSYSWRFELDEMKNPILDTIIRSGWEWYPVTTFWRIFNG